MRNWVGRGILRIGAKHQLRQRSIVWAWLRSHTGVEAPYRRRCVVISPDSDIAVGKPIRVVGVTTDYDGQNTELFFPMPHASQGHPETTLSQPCAARVDWTDVFSEDELEHAYGQLPRAEFVALITAMEAYARKGIQNSGSMPSS